MSNKKHSQIWETNILDSYKLADNKDLSKKIVKLLLHNFPFKTAESVAADLNYSIKRVQNWIYLGTGLTAFDLLRLMQEYEFMKNFVKKVMDEFE